jgi:hypothetical protein
MDSTIGIDKTFWSAVFFMPDFRTSGVINMLLPVFVSEAVIFFLTFVIAVDVERRGLKGVFLVIIEYL